MVGLSGSRCSWSRSYFMNKIPQLFRVRLGDVIIAAGLLRSASETGNPMDKMQLQLSFCRHCNRANNGRF